MKDIANSFNEYFSNIRPNLSEKNDMSENTMTYSDYLTNPVLSKFSFSPVSEKETLNIINNFKKKEKKLRYRWHFKCTSEINSKQDFKTIDINN